jgi:hypothetical protein
LPDNILATLKDRLRRDMNELADYMAGGGCLSSEDPGKVALAYARNAGKVEGLAMAERTLLDILEEIDEQERLDT